MVEWKEPSVRWVPASGLRMHATRVLDHHVYHAPDCPAQNKQKLKSKLGATILATHLKTLLQWQINKCKKFIIIEQIILLTQCIDLCDFAWHVEVGLYVCNAISIVVKKIFSSQHRTLLYQCRAIPTPHPMPPSAISTAFYGDTSCRLLFFSANKSGIIAACNVDFQRSVDIKHKDYIFLKRVKATLQFLHSVTLAITRRACLFNAVK
jgi:hypothetical protein